MKFLQKILFVTMVVVLGWNANVHGMHPVLDFNSIAVGNVPSCLIPKIYTHGVPPPPHHIAPANMPNINCIYFAIPQNGIIANVLFANPVNPIVPANTDHNIYFPADGSQPTTANAVNYALANIDNRENSPITEWYMKMFGVIPIVHGGHVFVHAGWNALATNAQQIITFHANFNGNILVNNPNSHGPISRENLFKQNFRKIASTSVGRTLLYRILIEIRRHVVNNVGCQEHGTIIRNINWRNASRSIQICWGSPAFNTGAAHPVTNGSIYVHNVLSLLSSIGEDCGAYDGIIMQYGSSDVSLFHEMNHWYHWLRDQGRYYNEYNLANLHFDDIGVAAEISRYYYGNLGNWINRDISEENWKVGNARIDFEEMRNILGGANVPNSINGDDLSDNLYRMCTGMPIRFGYNDLEYYEDARVTDKALLSCTAQKCYYNCVPRKKQGVGFRYADPHRAGLGNSRLAN